MKLRKLALSITFFLTLFVVFRLTNNVQSGSACCLDDFSNYTPGQPPAGWLIRGSGLITPTVIEVGGVGPNYRLVNFPEVPWQYWDKWLIKSGVTLSGSYVVETKMQFKTAIADRAGLTIAWNDTNGNHIDIQPNIYGKDIEFRVTYTGPNPNNPVIKLSTPLPLPINVNTPYWLKAVVNNLGPGIGTVDVYWSSDHQNYTQVIQATGLPDVTGLAGISTAGPHMPNTYFDDFSETSTGVDWDLKQYNTLWANEPYDWHYVPTGTYEGTRTKVAFSDSDTIRNFGCFITSSINMMRFWGILIDKNGLEVNPKNINDYLSTYSYTNPKTGEVSIGYPYNVASYNVIELYAKGRIGITEVPTPNSSDRNQAIEQVIDTELGQNQPVMVGVPFIGKLLFDVGLNFQNDLSQKIFSQNLRQEFINYNAQAKNKLPSLSDNIKVFDAPTTTNPNRWWISDVGATNGKTGYFAVADSKVIHIYKGDKNSHWVLIVGTKINGHYPIHDPGSRSTDLSAYSDTDGIGRMLLIETANGYTPSQRIALHSPAELLVTDPLGRRLGYDPVSQSFINEIPDAYYVLEDSVVNEDTGESVGETEKVLYLSQSESGPYSLKVYGTGEGPYAIDFQTIDSNGLFSTESIEGNTSLGATADYSYKYDGATINTINQPPKLTVPAQVSGQYSDFVAISASAVDPDDVGNALSFTAADLPNGLTLLNNNDGTATVSGILSVLPGTYPITITVTDPGSLSETKSIEVNVLPEDALVTYTGSALVSTGCATCTIVTIPLRTTVQDMTAFNSISDPYAGDITKAIVTFVNRDNDDVVMCTATPVLLNPADTKTGTASCNWTTDIGSNLGQDFTIGTVVSGFYTRDSSADDTLVVVSKPTSNFITGGGYLINTTSAGVYAGDPNVKTNFAINVKFSSKLTNLQGQATFITRQGGHTYQIQSTTLSSLVAVPYLSTKPSTGVAELYGIAIISDVTDSQNPIVVHEDVKFQLSIKDNGEPGSTDTISFTVMGLDGRLLFSSNWNGIKSLHQTIAGGNLQVH